MLQFEQKMLYQVCVDDTLHVQYSVLLKTTSLQKYIVGRERGSGTFRPEGATPLPTLSLESPSLFSPRLGTLPALSLTFPRLFSLQLGIYVAPLSARGLPECKYISIGILDFFTGRTNGINILLIY